MADFTSRFNELLARHPGNDSDLGSILGVSKQTISAWRTGVRSPKKTHIILLADHFGVGIPWLLGIEDDEQAGTAGAHQRGAFARNLRQYMAARGASQADIVAALGITASTVSDWVNGKKYPRVDAMQQLADYLGVLLSDLTSEVEKAPTPPADPLEAELVDIYRGLNAKGQDMLVTTARSFAANPDLKKGGEGGKKAI